MKYIELLGRIFFSLMFLQTIVNHFSPNAVGYATSKGVPFASLLVPLSGIIAFLGALSIILGFKAKIGAWLIAAFLIPVTLLMHQFWTVADPMGAQAERINFMKNLSMLGGAFIIAYWGSGPISFDGLRRRRKHEVSSERVKSMPGINRGYEEKTKRIRDKKNNY